MTTEKKVLQVLQCINISKAAEVDKISRKFWKDGSDTLAKSIAKLCNISIFSGLFSSDYKIAKSKPLYQKGSKKNPENVQFIKGYWMNSIWPDR